MGSRQILRKGLCASVLHRPFTFSNSNRQLFTSSVRRTDGVYQDLTNMRVRTPWIQALHEKQYSSNDPAEPSAESVPPSQRDLTPKKMSDSFHRVVIPLAEDPFLGDRYLNASGNIRIGTLLMDLDALSGVISYKHTGEGVTTVTAAVDRITINHPLKELCNLELSGRVTFATGRSSMEIVMQCAKAPSNGNAVRPEDVLLTCAFTMVSLDPVTKKPVPIPPLQLDTKEERELFAVGERNSNAKKALAKRGLRKQPPNDEESDLIHAMWLKQLEYHDPTVSTRRPLNVMNMSSTRMELSQIMHPQHRNRHNFMIFGGYLLKQTFELAFCCAASFSHSRPIFLSLDPSVFANPVPVGSILYLTATVAYTDPPLITGSGLEEVSTETSDNSSNACTRVQIRVDSKVKSIEHAEAKPTGQFNYTFLVQKDVKVMPQTYSEFMIWLDARRRAQRVEETFNNTLSSSNEDLRRRFSDNSGKSLS